jgi:CrcB protein
LAVQSDRSHDISSASAPENCSVFPSLGTPIINIVGSFLIGIFVESFALKWDLPQVARVFLTVGICGGFTTFSAFSLDAYVLLQRGEQCPAVAYMAGSVVLSVAALFAGLHLIRAVS